MTLPPQLRYSGDIYLSFCSGRDLLQNPIQSMALFPGRYFEQAVEVCVGPSNLNMRVYYTPPKVNGAKSTVLICHHGAGYSGLSFACFTKEVTRLSNGECGILSLDAREHGVSFFNSLLQTH